MPGAGGAAGPRAPCPSRINLDPSRSGWSQHRFEQDREVQGPSTVNCTIILGGKGENGRAAVAGKGQGSAARVLIRLLVFLQMNNPNPVLPLVQQCITVFVKTLNLDELSLS